MIPFYTVDDVFIQRHLNFTSVELLANYLCVSLWDEEGECISCLLGFFQVSPGFSPLCDASGQVFTKLQLKGSVHFCKLN
jgi:hypothetical protein